MKTRRTNDAEHQAVVYESEGGGKIYITNFAGDCVFAKSYELSYLFEILKSLVQRDDLSKINDKADSAMVEHFNKVQNLDLIEPGSIIALVVHSEISLNMSDMSPETRDFFIRKISHLSEVKIPKTSLF